MLIKFNMQLRRQTRLRRDYLYRKSQEQQIHSIYEKKQKLKEVISGPS